MRPLALALFLATALLLTAPASSPAAACPNNLTVAGIPVTGTDCTDVGNGETLIDQPRLLSGQVVRIAGRMILDQSHGSMRQETVGVPLVASVLNGAGTTDPFIAGTIRVGTFQ